MMCKAIFISLTIFCTFSFVDAQHVFKNDTLFLKNGVFLTKNQKLKLGKGIGPNGNFKHIEVNVNNIMRHKGLKSKDPVYLENYHALSAYYNNKESRIIRVVERGKKNKKFYAVIGVGDLKRYQVEIDNAIKTGEIILNYSSYNHVALLIN